MPTLERLLAGPHRVAGVVSQPDRPRGRGRKLSPSPVAERALAAGVPLLRPERVGDAGVVAALRELAPDLGVVVAFGQFLPKTIRELPRLGYGINAHASLLPRHRGAAPIAHAILAGDAETGISVMRVEREMDAGAVCLVKRTPIGADETTGGLEAAPRRARGGRDRRGARRDRERRRALDAPGRGARHLRAEARPRGRVARPSAARRRAGASRARARAAARRGAPARRREAAHPRGARGARPRRPRRRPRRAGGGRAARGDRRRLARARSASSARAARAARRCEFLRGFDVPDGARLERPALGGEADAPGGGADAAAD